MRPITLLALAPFAAALSVPQLPASAPVVSSLHRSQQRPAQPLGVDNFTFLDNGIVRLGIDTTRGGTLGWLGPSSNTSLSLLNVHDFGRVVQGSFYSGPNPFNPEGKCSEPGGWGRPWPWNPIGAGDVYLHAAPIINLTVAPDGASAVVWTVPYQWACDTVPCDCLFEQRISLVGNAVEVRFTLHTDRADKTFYPGQTQELPAVYIIGDYCHLWTYNGSAPFTGDAATEQPAVWGANAWDRFVTGERWMAFTNASGWGVGVVSPFVANFGAGFFNDGKIGTYNCTPKGLGPYDSPTGYIAPWGAEVIDPTAAYEYEFSLVLGTLADIRAYAGAAHAAGRDEPLTPDYDFAGTGGRAHCVYMDAQDGGLPMGPGGVALNATGPHPGIVGPISAWAPRAAPVVRVNASYAPQWAGATAALWWVGAGGGSPCAECVATAVVAAGGGFQELVFQLGGNAAYDGLAQVEQVLFQPVGAAPLAPAHLNTVVAQVASIVAK